ncbi:hypothetical protein DAI22_02g228000 [Oryza sativa Japonica Group]|nr:hypothetical protein DAI22_02g228000 [Oryza sativa Japonica Group]
MACVQICYSNIWEERIGGASGKDCIYGSIQCNKKGSLYKSVIHTCTYINDLCIPCSRTPNTTNIHVLCLHSKTCSTQDMIHSKDLIRASLIDQTGSMGGSYWECSRSNIYKNWWSRVG